MDRAGVVQVEVNYSLFVAENFEVVPLPPDELDDHTYFVEVIKPQPFHLDQNCECTRKLSSPLIQPVNKNSAFLSLKKLYPFSSPDLILNALRPSLKCT